jgi:uncharacterized protein (TIGR03084 family)
MEQARQLAEEGQDILALLEPLDEAEWRRTTQFRNWTVNDTMLHLHMINVQALLTATDQDSYVALRKDILAKRRTMSMIDETRARLPGVGGRALLDLWWRHLEHLCRVLATMPPECRLRWAEREMSARTVATARQMEHWALAQRIHDVLGKPRLFQDRIRNIAELGVRTFGFSFSNRGLHVPPASPYVRLESPSGLTWEWNSPSDSESVIGSAVDFCHVVTQARNVHDTQLCVTGATATAWLSIAQCFGGPPSDPPAPGSRFMVQPGA